MVKGYSQSLENAEFKIQSESINSNQIFLFKFIESWKKKRSHSCSDFVSFVSFDRIKSAKVRKNNKFQTVSLVNKNNHTIFTEDDAPSNTKPEWIKILATTELSSIEICQANKTGLG